MTNSDKRKNTDAIHQKKFINSLINTDTAQDLQQKTHHFS